jgi:hypothetical protein
VSGVVFPDISCVFDSANLGDVGHDSNISEINDMSQA